MSQFNFKNHPAIAQLTQKLKEVEDLAGRAISQAAQELIFNKYPAVKEFTWTQYANYFCDGGPCNFYVHDYETTINGVDYEDSEGLEAIGEGADACMAFLSQIPSDIFKKAFGPDQRVTLYQDGRVVNEEYSDHE